MNTETHSLNIDLSLFKNSLELDADIVAKLSGCLMSSTLVMKNEGDLYKFSANDADNFSNSLMKYSVFSDEVDPSMKVEILQLREKLKEVSKYFEFINNERKLFRGIVMTMLQKKFWSILADEKTNQFFVSKLGGINTELMKKRINVLESNLEELKTQVITKDSSLKLLLEEKSSMTKKLEKANADLKKLILEEGKNKTNTLDSNNSSPNIVLNSITVDPPQIQRNPMHDLANMNKGDNKNKSVTKMGSRALSKKDSLVNSSSLQGGKESSVTRNLKQKSDMNLYVDEYIGPDLDQVQTVYQSKAKRPDSTRHRK
jgi:hypothetical protein